MVTSQGPADPEFSDVLESAARLQALVPDAVLVGGSAAAFYAHHRFSVDHDHVVADLRERFATVLEALEREGAWVTNRVKPGAVILGELGGIESGVRQMIRTTPLEVEEHALPSGLTLRVPTFDETLRVKAFLIVKRNQVRDFLDVAALAETGGLPRAARVLRAIDDYYTDDTRHDRPVATQLVTQLADPQPRDARVIRDFARYKGVATRWREWATVVEVCQDLARQMYDLEA